MSKKINKPIKLKKIKKITKKTEPNKKSFMVSLSHHSPSLILSLFFDSLVELLRFLTVSLHP